MSEELFILIGILFGILFGVFLILLVEFTIACISDFLESLFEPRDKKKDRPTKKVYIPKKQSILDLIKNGKANSVSAPHFIENNLNVKSRLKFNDHKDKCEFLTLCDIIVERDGYITDYEVVNLLNATNKIEI